MPTFVTLDTIQEVMLERKCVAWRIFDEEENQIHDFAPKETTLPRDSFNTLKSFIEPIKGTNFLIIRVYAPEYVRGKGGDTSTTIFKYFYKLGTGSKERNEPVNGNNYSGSDDKYFMLLKEMHAMKLDFVERENKRELEILREELKQQKKEDGNYFERVAKVMGKEFAKEWLKAEGYDVDEDGVPTGKISGTGKEKTEPTKKEETTEDKEKKEKIKTAFNRTSDATVRIMKVAKTVGSNYDAVAESFEDIAKMAETNPLKLKELFDKLKENDKS